jgi:hypothetical protein
MKTQSLPWLALLSFFAPLLAGANSLQESQCIGSGGPVKAIYLHGWFETQGGGWRVDLETENRKKLTKLAALMGIRIAVPVSSVVKPDNNGVRVRFWDVGSATVANIESAAKAACGGQALAENRYLIGFSNGANRAWRLTSAAHCAQTTRYEQILVLGPASRSTTDRACEPRTRVILKHEVPPAAELRRLLEE